MLNYRNIFDNEGISYPQYREMIDRLLAEGRTTGTNHSEAMLHYTKMNVQRMKRVEKTTILSEELLTIIQRVTGHYHFLVITEGWCGDAAQIVPVLNRIAEASAGKFDLRVVLRDQHLPLIDAHLTHGGRAIPVLLVLDQQKELILPKWGPRPAVLQVQLAEWKKEGVEMPELAEKLHGWYAKDKTQHVQAELAALLAELV